MSDGSTVEDVIKNNSARLEWSILEDDPFINGYEYVDLGLPSGTKWAKCNVGANSETEAGLYFAWGETQGHTAGDGREFDSENYKFIEGDFPDSGVEDYSLKERGLAYNGLSMTKYNSSDGLTILLPEDDAAHVNMGGEWRMPTKEDFEELSSNTTSVWTTVNGVLGRTFTSNVNGNVLFVPAAGCIIAGQMYYYQDTAFLWTSSLRQEDVFNAWDFDAYSSYVGVSEGHRCEGQNVRGVVG
jgi:hypothetical protein